MKKLEELLKKYEIISFDIFDTLLNRPYINPYDILKHIEKYTESPGFAKNRYSAEGIARKKSKKEDITFDEIYENVDEKFKHLKKIELLFEETLLKTNKKTFKIYELARKLNKKIILVSDMYLSKTFLEKILIKNGYNHWDKFYLSNELGVAKYSGNLFKKIIEDLEISPKKILHIGDSVISDFKQPQKLGINTYRISNIAEQFFKDKNNKKYKKLYKINSNSLEISLILALFAEKYHQNRNFFKKDYWKNFGYCFGGPIGYGFAEYILKQTIENKCKDLLFIARDGYTLQKLVNILKKEDIKTFYVHAQRILRARILLDYGDQHNADLLLKIIDEKFNIEKKFYNFEEKKDYIKKNISKLKKEAYEKQKEYEKYLKNLNINFDNNILIVDTGAATFSAQQIIEKILNKKILGIYTIISKPEYAKEKNINYKTWANKAEDIKSITSLIEFCFSSPEKPIIDITQNGPIYLKNITKEEAYRIELYPEISKGNVNFVEDLNNRLCGLNIPFSALEINNYIEFLCCNLNKLDRMMLKKIYCSTNASHSEYNETLFDKINSNLETKGGNIFSIKNQYSNNKKHKIITILGIKFKIKIAEKRTGVRERK